MSTVADNLQTKLEFLAFLKKSHSLDGRTLVYVNSLETGKVVKSVLDKLKVGSFFITPTLDFKVLRKCIDRFRK